MQPSTLYQGHQFNPAQAPGGKVSTTLPFADEWNKNMQATTENLQALESALIERNDNTVLLNQQAEARNNDLQMTLELKQMLEKPDGEGGFYNANSQVDKVAVRDFVNKYVNLSRKWDKALLSPEAKMKSAASTDAYRFGVVKAVETALLANTKARQTKAFKDNLRLSLEMRDFNGANNAIQQGVDMNVLSEAEAAYERLKVEQADLEFRITNSNDVNELLDLWESPEFADQLNRHPDVRNAMENKIQQLNKTQAKALNDEYDPKTGKLKKGQAEPPDGAPLYIQTLFIKHKGEIPKNSSDSVSAIQQYLSEEITELDNTNEGLLQYSNAKAMADALNIDATVFNKAYDLRVKQISYGGFNASKILDNIVNEKFLLTTQADENLPSNLSNEDRDRAKQRIADTIRTSVLNEYNNWWAQNADFKPSVRDQYAKLLEITRRRSASQPAYNEIDLAVRRAANETLKREREIAKELTATKDRKRRTQKKEYNTLQWAARFGTKGLYYNGVSLEQAALSDGGVSTNIKFDYDLAPVDSTLPDSSTHNIIYLPKGEKLPATKANVTRRKGNLGFTVEFRHADVDEPTPSRKLLRSLGSPTRTPSFIKWDGKDLNVSDEDTAAQYSDYEETVYMSDTNKLLPDDGLSNEVYTYDDLELPI